MTHLLNQGLIGFPILLLFLSACGREGGNVPDVIAYDKWDNTVDMSDSTHPIFTDSILINSNSMMLITDENLFIEDGKSIDRVIHAFSMPEGEYLGGFGHFGQGPAEILNPGNLFCLGNGDIGLIDYGHWRVMAFNADSALQNSDYKPRTHLHLSSDNPDAGFPDRFVPVNDDWGIGRLIKPLNGGGYSQTLCRYDMTTGALSPFGPQENPRGYRSSVTASYTDSVIVEVSSTQDIIRFFDLNGNIRHIIHGPQYEAKPSREKAFYSKTVVGDGKLFAVYSGGSKFTDFYGKQITVFSLNGTYLYSYLFDDRITDMAYSQKYGRLYLGTDGEDQFAYIQVSRSASSVQTSRQTQNTDRTAQSGNNPNIKTNGNSRDKSSAVLTLTDPDDHIHITPVAQARIRPYIIDETKGSIYYLSVLNQTFADTVLFDSVIMDIPGTVSQIPNFPVIPRLMVSLHLNTEAPVKKGGQEVILTIFYTNKDNNKKGSQKLSITLLDK